MLCPLCDSRSNSFLEEKDRDYFLCPRCHLIFVPPEQFIPPEEEVHRYRQHNNTLDNPGYVGMFEKKIAVVEEVAQEIHSVLDYGCGPGPVLVSLLKDRGYQAWGYDPNFFPDTPLDSKFDLIISTETFEHLKSPGIELEKILSLIRPGGYLAVMTQFYPDPYEIALKEAFAGWYYKRDPTHICFFCPVTFEWMAERYDLEIVFNNKKDFVVLKLPSHFSIY